MRAAPRFFIMAVSLFAAHAAWTQQAPEAAATCVACHGATGNSITPLYPNLAGQHADYLYAQMKMYQSRERDDAIMRPLVADLRDEDLREIAEFYAAQEPAIQSIGIDQVAAGERIYRGGVKATNVPACMACHGPSGIGNPPAGYPALRGQHKEYTQTQLALYRDGVRATDPNEMMRTIAERLTIEQIDALATYISALH